MHVTGWCRHGHVPWVRMLAVWKHFVYWWFVSQYLGTLGNRLFFWPIGLTIHFIPTSQWNKLQEVQLSLESDPDSRSRSFIDTEILSGMWAQGSFEGLWLGVCACKCAHMCMPMCLCTCVLCVYMHVSVCVVVCLYGGLHVCTCVSVSVCERVFISMCLHVYV